MRLNAFGDPRVQALIISLNSIPRSSPTDDSHYLYFYLYLVCLSSHVKFSRPRAAARFQTYALYTAQFEILSFTIKSRVRTLVMDSPPKPPNAPDTASPRHSPDPQPRPLSETPGRSALPPRGPRFTTDLKRKEHYRESPVGSEENKRRKFPPSNMAAQVPGSRFWRSDGDDDKIDEDKGKPRKGEEWMRSELSRLQAEAENDKRNNKRNKQAMLLSLMQKQQRLDEAESNIRFWQLQVKTTKETAKEVLRKECAAHERAQTTTARNAQLVIQGLQAEIDHLQDVNATITSDLHELRVLESEAAAKRKDQTSACRLHMATSMMRTASRHTLNTRMAAQSRWLTSNAKPVSSSKSSSPEL